MKVAILHFNHAVLSSVTGPYDILSKMNDLLNFMGMEGKFRKMDVRVVSTTHRTTHNQDHTADLLLTSGTTIHASARYDLVIIPAMDFNKIPEVLENEKPLIDWIRWQYNEGAEVASICLGAFILAKTGLLDGKSATTHWMGAGLFRRMFPDVSLADDKIIVDYHKIYTCGGAFAFTSLMMYLIEKYFGQEVSIMASKIFLIHVHDTRQFSYAILNLQKGHNNERIKKIQDYIETHYAEAIPLEKMAQIAHMSSRTFIRHFKKATGNTPYEYLQRVRVEAAKKKLEKAHSGIETIGMDVGYEDFGAFRRVFKRYAGLTPTDYKKRYGKMFLPGFVEISG